MSLLTIERLETRTFAQYGDVIEPPHTGGIARHDFLNGRPGAKIDLLAACPPALCLPLILKRLERHPLSSQLFMPLGIFEYLVVVALDDGGSRPRLETLRAFEVSDGIGVCLAPTTWHRSVAGLGHDGSFATVTCYAGDPEDIIHFDIPTMTIEEPRK